MLYSCVFRLRKFAFIGSLLLSALTLSVTPQLHAADADGAKKAETSRPNVVFILADDM
ncbi:MAG: hypothetical protein KDA89_22970 [Planctomycetaceae bacterium]|nr:hypothetical protein [Planctomycetaceae bacterium]